MKERTVPPPVAYKPPSEHIMYIGKYKGMTLDKVPREYLQWWMRQGIKSSPGFNRAIAEQLEPKQG